MARRLRPIGHEDRLSVVDHLDELRSRLIICGVALGIAFAACFWQNHLLLRALNDPLNSISKTARNHISGVAADQVGERAQLLQAAGDLALLGRSTHLAPSDAGLLAAAADHMTSAAKSLPKHTPGVVPITTYPGEPFTTTLTVCFYFALLLALPVLLYELYAFIIPALTPAERGVARPVMIAAPALFIAGVVFTYLIVLPAAIKFLQGYNASNYNALIQAKPLYSFEVLVMGSIGLAFQLPLALLGLRQLGVINGSTLTRHWRYATVIIAVIAAAMPGADPVTTGLETAPLVVLFIASIVMLKYADRRDARRAAAELAKMDETSNLTGEA